MKKDNISKGKLGEKYAIEYLIKNGYKIIEVNYNTKIGELDIIALYNRILVIIEVKTRTNIEYGYPYESVDKRKQRKIINTSYVFIKSRGLIDVQLRFDIIEVYMTNNFKINHIIDAFQE